MSRRAALPGASELFRATGKPAAERSGAAGSEHGSARSAADGSGGAPEAGSETAESGGARDLGRGPSTRGGSGRQKHDSKITVYLSADELFEVEQARLTLRGQHRLPVDRGRIVREALAVVLEDFDEQGERSVLVQRLLAETRSEDGA